MIRVSFESDGESRLAEFESGTVVLGRSAECDVVFPGGQGVSSRHAQLHFDGTHWTLTDLNSRYGTLVNSRPISNLQLQSGDKIKLGRIHVRVEFPVSAATDSEDNDGVSILNSINIDEFARSLELDRRSATLNAISDEPRVRKPALHTSAFGVFNRAGEILLSARTLDDLLEEIIGLLLATFACDRGAVGLYDTNSDQFQLRCKKSLNPADKFQISKTIVSEVLESRNCVLVEDTRRAHYAQAASLQQQLVRSALCAPLYHAGEIIGLMYVDTQKEGFRFSHDDLECLAAVALFTAVGLEQFRLRDRVEQEQRARERLARYSSPAVVERIVAATGTGDIDVEEREVTVLFADLSGFTSMSETMTPKEISSFLNEVFERLTQAIFDEQGTVDKFIGDAIMAFFGAPLAQPDHAARAVRSGIRMQEELDRYNCELFGTPKVRMRIGINTGPVVAGDIGSSSRRDYTVIGDTVNTASRLESSVAAPHQIVIGPATHQAVSEFVECLALEPRMVKGKAAPLQSYLVLGLRN